MQKVAGGSDYILTGAPRSYRRVKAILDVLLDVSLEDLVALVVR